MHRASISPSGGVLRAAFFLLCLSLSAAVHADVVDDALAALRAGKAEEGYRLLAPLAHKAANDPRLGAVLGIAALDSGRAQIAADALEGVLKTNPGLTAVRVDLARAYLALGRFDDAKRELRRVFAENPPDAAELYLERLLILAEDGIRARAGVATGFVEAGIGYDSNITAVTSNFTSGVQGAYGLPGFQPTGSSVLRHAAYAQMSAGVDYLKPLDTNWALVGGLSGYWRGYDQFSSYNQAAADIRLGTLFASGAHVVRLSAIVQRYDQETDAPGTPKPTADRRVLGLSADWRYNIDPLYTTGVLLGANRIRYPDNSVVDTDELLVAASLTRRFLGPLNASITLTSSYADDRAVNTIPGSATGADYGRTVAGARLAGQLDPVPGVTLYASFGYYTRRDTSDFARSTLIASGTDHETDYMLGVSWRFAPGWSVRAQANHTDNRSNISLYSYRRTETFVGLRHDFR